MAAAQAMSILNYLAEPHTVAEIKTHCEGLGNTFLGGSKQSVGKLVKYWLKEHKTSAFVTY
jgi:hypothetical protein